MISISIADALVGGSSELGYLVCAANLRDIRGGWPDRMQAAAGRARDRTRNAPGPRCNRSSAQRRREDQTRKRQCLIVCGSDAAICAPISRKTSVPTCRPLMYLDVA